MAGSGLKLPLGAMIVFAGYAILWTGWRNIDITYTPSKDGSSPPTPSHPPMTLYDAITCRQPGGQPGQPAPLSNTPNAPTGGTPQGQLATQTRPAPNVRYNPAVQPAGPQGSTIGGLQGPQPTPRGPQPGVTIPPFPQPPGIRTGPQGGLLGGLTGYLGRLFPGLGL